MGGRDSETKSERCEQAEEGHNVAWAEAYLHTKWHLDPCRRLATTDMGRKFGVVPL